MSFAPLRVLCEDDGVALVEYGLISAVITLVALGTLQLMGLSINDLFTNLTANWSSSAESGQ
jgi:Flp pilus assembly pilin Flp